MNHTLFNKFFQIGKVKVGPTVCRFYRGADQIGTIEIKPTTKNPILTDGYCVAVQEDEIGFQPEMRRALYLLGIDLKELQKYLLSLYYEYWKNDENPKKPILNHCHWIDYLQKD